MENMSWLKQLAPAHAPPPPGLWPLAPGWWGLLVLLLLAVLIYGFRRYAGRRRRAALRELKQMCINEHFAIELQNLLRRYAIAVYGRETVASLSGENWLNFLVSHGGTGFAGEAGNDFLRAAYGAPSQADPDRWLQAARGFLRGKK